MTQPASQLPVWGHYTGLEGCRAVSVAPATPWAACCWV